MSAAEFLNTLAYREEKIQREKREIEKWKQRH